MGTFGLLKFTSFIVTSLGDRQGVWVGRALSHEEMVAGQLQRAFGAKFIESALILIMPNITADHHEAL